MRIRNVLLIMGGVMTLNAAFAQKIEVGVKAGLNASNINLNNEGKLLNTNYNGKATFHVGAYAQIRLHKIAIQPEIVFSRQGQHYSTPYNSNLSTNLNYLNIPLVFKYYVVGGLNVQAGPQLGFLIASKGDLLQLTSDGLGNITGKPIEGQDLGQYVKGTELSWTFGAAIDVPFGGSLTVRYNVGATDINKFTGAPRGGLPNNQTTSLSTAVSKNQVLQISLSYRLRKFGK